MSLIKYTIFYKLLLLMYNIHYKHVHMQQHLPHSDAKSQIFFELLD